MNLIYFAVRKPIAASMLILIAVLMGYYFYLKVPATLLPEFEMKMLNVDVRYPGASTEDMARLVTEPLEGFLELIHGLKKMNSRTGEGFANFNLEFRDSIDIALARIEAHEKIEAAQLPVGVETSIFQFDTSSMPVLAMDVFGGADKISVQNFARDTLKTSLERLSGVGKVNFNGGRDSEIRISIPENELRRFGFSLNTIWQAIYSENISPIGGRLREGRKEYLVRTVGRLKVAEDFRMLPIRRKDGPPVLLKDIANITETLSPPTSFYRFNDRAAVMLEVSKKPSANTLELCREIKETIKEAEDAETSGITVDVYLDASEMIEKVLSGIKSDLFIGLFVAAFILIIFLKNMRTSMIILASVPVCIVATFVPMYMLGINLNLLSLMGFALVSGMLVDNAIIILENVYRFIRKGLSANRASEDGPMEVRSAVITSTLTSMAVFVPIFFISSAEMKPMRDLAFTAIFALGSSLMVAFVLVPLMASKFLKSGLLITSDNRAVESVITYSGLNFVGRSALRVFETISAWSQSRWWKRLLLIIIVIGGLFAGMALKPPRDKAQMGDPNHIFIRVETGGGTTILRTDGVIRDIQKYIREHFKRAEDISAWSHKGGGGMFVELWTEAEFHEKFPGELFMTREQIQEQIVMDYRWMPDVKVLIRNTDVSNPSGESFVLRIVGRHFQALKSLSEETRDALLSIEGVYLVETDFDLPGEEVRVNVDHHKAADMGISPQEISTILRQNLSGGVAFAIPREGDKIDVRVTRPASEPLDVKAVKNLTLPHASGTRISVDQLADVDTVRTSPTLRREDGEFHTTLKVFYRDGISLEELKEKILNDNKTGALDRTILPPGYRYAWGGVVRSMEEQQEDLMLFAVSAIGLVFLIMAAQFESFFQPLIVMFTLPLAYVGAILGVAAAGMQMNEMAIMGTIILLGIVVNDAIVLVDYVNLQRRQGKDRNQAIAEAVRVRIRPIFMTTLTTVGALLPLLFGMEEGEEFRKPMAAVVASGLMFATVLTLLFIPAVYSFSEDLKDLVGMIWLRIKIMGAHIKTWIRSKRKKSPGSQNSQSLP